MSDEREQIDRLLSRRGDPDLTAEDHARIAKAVAEDPTLADEQRRYDRLARLVASWRPLPEGVDFCAFSHRVSASVEDELAASASADLDRLVDPNAIGDPREASGPRLNSVASSFQALEDLIQDTTPAVPEVDWNAYKQRVSAAVRQEANRDAVQRRAAGRWQRFARLAAPAAAAAAIALVVLWPSNPTPLILVEMPIPVAHGAVEIDVGYDQEVPEAQPLPGGTAIVISTPDQNDYFDEAYFY